MSEKLDKAMADLQKVFGKGAIGKAKELVVSKGSYSTGSLQLDATLGGGGYPKGRLIEVKGPYSSGKTTSTLHAIADCQAQGHTAMFIDLEGTLDLVYARSLGVDTEALYYIAPNTGESAMEMAEKLARTGDIGLIVVDSVAALLPGKIAEDEYGKANMAFHAKLVGEMVKRFVPILHQNDICMLALNQIRLNPGVSFGNPEYSTGGTALPFYASVIVDIRKSGAVLKDKNGNTIGEPRKIKIIKSKINASLNQTMMVDIQYGEGFDQVGEIVDVGTELDIITKGGSWYSYDGSKIGQGREAAKQFFRDNPGAFEEVKKQVLGEVKIELSADMD